MRSPATTGRITLGLLAVAALLGVPASSAPPPVSRPPRPPSAAQVAATRSGWVGIWAASPVPGSATAGCPAGPGQLDGHTVRDVVFASAGGNLARVRLTNEFGTGPLVVGGASLAVAGTGAGTVPGTMRVLRFRGRPDVTIPPGTQAISDPVPLAVHPFDRLAVSVFVSRLSGAATVHQFAAGRNYLAAGNQTAAREPAGREPAGRETAGQATAGQATAGRETARFSRTVSCWLLVSGVDVAATGTVPGTLVAFGDSITDGARSTVDANRRWPDDLARRARAGSGTGLAIVDQGISGNRLLLDGYGPSALSRLDRDVLRQPGAAAALVLEGVNDIGATASNPRSGLTASDLIAGYRQIIARCHAAGLRVYAGTLTPFKGVPNYWSPAGQRTRDAVNDWIRTSGEFDGVVDFATVLGDPSDPQMFDPAYDSGDHLHPNDAGYQAMADAIDLRWLAPG